MELKDWILFVLGIVVGFFFSVWVYWGPLGQFTNECCSLWSLRKKFNKGDDVTVKSGTDLKPVDLTNPVGTITQNTVMKVWHDEGIGWFHTSSGWRRTRILHVYSSANSEVVPVYKICYLDLVV